MSCEMVPSNLAIGRLRARAERLPPPVLVDALVKVATVSPVARRYLDQYAAAHDPLPEWATSDVLLSPDLMSHVLGALNMVDWAAAAVCTVWRQVWLRTAEQRRGLRPWSILDQSALGLPYDERVVTAANNPDGDMLFLQTGCGGSFEDATCNVMYDVYSYHDDRLIKVHTVGPNRSSALRASSQMLVAGDWMYVAGDEGLDRVALGSGERHCTWDCRASAIALGPDGALFATGARSLLCLDAHTLTERFEFGADIFYCNGHGRDKFRCLVGIAVHNGEVYAADNVVPPCFHVFDASTGEHRREIRIRGDFGPFGQIQSFLIANDRLYVVEYSPDKIYDDPQYGRRILVLSPSGETLQIYWTEAWQRNERRIDHIARWGPRLLVVFDADDDLVPIGEPWPSVHVLAGI